MVELRTVVQLYPEFVEIKVAHASEVEGQSIPEADCFIDLSGSNLPMYLLSRHYVPDEDEESKSHSTDSNSENAPGNDYGDTPSSSRTDSDSDNSYQDRSEDDENERRMKRLVRMMDKNKPTDSDEEDYDDYNSRKKKKGYVNTAQDAWFTREEYDDDY